MPCSSDGYEPYPSPPRFPLKWHIETLCNLCKEMSFNEMKNQNDLLEWYIEHLLCDYHFNKDSEQKEIAKKELNRLGENISI